MEGGGVIAEGGYGCIYHPELLSDGTENEKKEYVSKLQIYNDAAKREIKIGKKIEEISNYMRFFSPIISYSFIENKKVRKNKLLKECKNSHIQSKLKDNKSELALMKMYYINGESFYYFIINRDNSSYIINNIINSYNHLLKGFELLIKNKICHFDIKGENILFDKDLLLPIIIDFGLSIDITSLKESNLKNYFYIHYAKYYIWPLEIHYLTFLLHNNSSPTKEELQKIAYTYTENNRGLKYFLNDFKKKYYKSCLDQLHYYNNLNYSKRLNKILSFWKSWDNYAMSIMYLSLIHNIYNKGYEDNKFLVFFIELLLQNIHPNPIKRLSISETYKTFNSFLLNKNINNIKTFEELKKMFFKNKKNINDNLTKDKTIIQYLTRQISR